MYLGQRACVCGKGPVTPRGQSWGPRKCRVGILSRASSSRSVLGQQPHKIGVHCNREGAHCTAPAHQHGHQVPIVHGRRSPGVQSPCLAPPPPSAPWAEVLCGALAPDLPAQGGIRRGAPAPCRDGVSRSRQAKPACRTVPPPQGLRASSRTAHSLGWGSGLLCLGPLQPVGRRTTPGPGSTPASPAPAPAPSAPPQTHRRGSPVPRVGLTGQVGSPTPGPEAPVPARETRSRTSSSWGSARSPRF